MMLKKPIKWIRNNYQNIVNSIAFYPAIIALSFLALAIIMQEFDFSAAGKHIKATAKWISLKDANTARTIVSTIAAGIISLTVFSFSMVMIVLNQAASQMSNRVLEGMIANRFQQFVLGFYIGSIVYSLGLLTTIRDIDSGIYIPALSIYLLLLITIADIFIFIYFLHYVTQSVKFQTIIRRVHDKTLHSLEKSCTEEPQKAIILPKGEPELILMENSGYYQSFDKKQLVNIASKHNAFIHFLNPRGSYLLKGVPLLHFYSKNKLSDQVIKDILIAVDCYPGEEIENNPFYGFHQLAEVAIKALSPGINDPQTAVLSLHSLTDLFSYKLNHYSQSTFRDENNIPRVQMLERSFEELFSDFLFPIWDYGKKDLFIQHTMLNMVNQLIKVDIKKEYKKLFDDFLNIINREVEKNDIKIPV